MNESLPQEKQKRRIPFWLIIIGIGLLGIASYYATGDSSLGQLLFLILFLAISAKILWLAWRVGSILLKIFLVIVVLLIWFGTFLSQSPVFR